MNRVNIDGLMMHSAVGTLATLDASQSVPVSATTIDPLIANYIQVQILWPRGLERTQHFAAGYLVVTCTLLLGRWHYTTCW
jgi:hypothetical protein